MNTTRV